jgi:hypothetical protein
MPRIDAGYVTVSAASMRRQLRVAVPWPVSTRDPSCICAARSLHKAMAGGDPRTFASRPVRQRSPHRHAVSIVFQGFRFDFASRRRPGTASDQQQQQQQQLHMHGDDKSRIRWIQRVHDPSSLQWYHLLVSQYRCAYASLNLSISCMHRPLYRSASHKKTWRHRAVSCEFSIVCFVMHELRSNQDLLSNDRMLFFCVTRNPPSIDTVKDKCCA